MECRKYWDCTSNMAAGNSGSWCSLCLSYLQLMVGFKKCCPGVQMNSPGFGQVKRDHKLSHVDCQGVRSVWYLLYYEVGESAGKPFIIPSYWLKGSSFDGHMELRLITTSHYQPPTRVLAELHQF